MTPLYARLSGALLVLLLLAVPAQAADTVPIDVVDGALVWTPESPYAEAMLTLSSPSGVEYRRAFGAGQAVRLHPSEMGDVPLADGFYEYRLVLAATIPDVDEPAEATSLTGTIEVRGGQAVASPLLDIQHLDDVIISGGSLCVGFDCANGESFGFDTIRLKENNIRIHFQDTSTTSSFPRNDWRIVINDTNNGGGSFFAIEDSDTGRQVFRVDAGAPTNALRVDRQGEVGIGTGTPVTDIHIVSGNTPTTRYEQNGSSGFTAQTFDVAANESNFFVRDATFGSKLPFRIRPNSLTSSIDVGPGGVGFNNSSPGNVVHIKARDAASASERALNVDGHTRLGGDVFTAGRYAAFYPSSMTQPALQLADVTNIPNPILKVEVNGDHTITGTSFAVTHTNTSDVHVKENITPADVDAILEGVVSLPISTWEYIADEADALHLGPMAQDFRAAFGLGVNDTTISTIDSEGVALAAIQALAARNEASAARIAGLEAANAALEARLARLEALLGADHE